MPTRATSLLSSEDDEHEHDHTASPTTLANLRVLAHQELYINAIVQMLRPKNSPIRTKGIVLEDTWGRCSGVRNDPTGVEGQWGSQTPRLPTYCHLATTDTIARLAQIEEHAAPTAHSAPHMPYRKTPLWCGYPRFNHRARACRLTCPSDVAIAPAVH